MFNINFVLNLIIMSAELSSLVSRLEAVTTRLEKAAGGGGAGDAGPSAEMVTEYEDYIAQYINPFVTATNKIASEDVKKAGALLKELAEEQKKFLVIVSQHAEPSQEVIAKLLQPSSDIMTDIGRIKDRTFKDKEYSSYTAAINEGMTAFGWVMVKPAPSPYVKECGNGAQFYTNRILKDRQDKEWVKSWTCVFQPLQEYVKKHHTTGLSWNTRAPIATLAAAASSGGSAAPAPPACPPPPPAPVAGAPAPSSDKPAADVSALLNDINKGLSVTSGLKKVTDDMKTHKNPKLRLQTAVPYKAPSADKPKPVSKPTAAPVKKTPVLALRGKKWIVEHHSGRKDLVIDDALMKHTVYVFKCDNCTLQIKSKVNQIILDNCKKVGVVFDTIVSSLEFVNCQSVQAQVTGSLPTCSIEKTDGCQLYLNENSIDCQIFTAKSSEMNISIPKDGDYVEYPIVEQFRTTWNGKTFVTEPSEIVE